MSNNKKTIKKQERAIKVKEKILRRREAIRKKAKVDRESQMSQRESQRIANRVDGKTIVNRSAEDQHNLLQRNWDILKALEDQQNFLEQEKKAPQVQHERARGIKQTADVCFIPNPETNEPLVAEEEKKETEEETVCETATAVLDNDVLDPAASRLAEKLHTLSKKRTMKPNK